MKTKVNPATEIANALKSVKDPTLVVEPEPKVEDVRQADPPRIVACVIACEGIDDPQQFINDAKRVYGLVMPCSAIEAARTLNAALEERDQLLVRMEEMLDVIQNYVEQREEYSKVDFPSGRRFDNMSLAFDRLRNLLPEDRKGGGDD